MCYVCSILYADLALKLPSGVQRHTVLSSCSRNVTSAVASQRSRNSAMAAVDMLPEMPRVHYMLASPWRTVILDLILLETSCTRLGAMSDGAV